MLSVIFKVGITVGASVREQIKVYILVFILNNLLLFMKFKILFAECNICQYVELIVLKEVLL